MDCNPCDVNLNVFYDFCDKFQAESSESYVWIGSQTNTECQPNMECSGCHQLRKEVDSLRSMLMNASVHQRDDDVRCHSTYISDQKQKEIDKMLLDARSKSEMFQEAYEKVKNIRPTAYLSSILTPFIFPQYLKSLLTC